MLVAPYGKCRGRIKLSKYTVGIPRRPGKALIKHPSEALLVFPLPSSVSLYFPHPQSEIFPEPLHPYPSQAFRLLSRGSTARLSRLPKAAPVSHGARLSDRKKTQGKLEKEVHILIQFSAFFPGQHLHPKLAYMLSPGDAASVYE